MLGHFTLLQSVYGVFRFPRPNFPQHILMTHNICTLWLLLCIPYPGVCPAYEISHSYNKCFTTSFLVFFIFLATTVWHVVQLIFFIYRLLCVRLSCDPGSDSFLSFVRQSPDLLFSPWSSPASCLLQLPQEYTRLCQPLSSITWKNKAPVICESEEMIKSSVY